jgi:hypothetical protein
MQDFDFGLSDSEYWTDPERTDLEVADKLWALKRDVVAIGAPHFVALGQRQSLPMLVTRAGTFEALASTWFSDYAVLSVVDLENNNAMLGRAIKQPPNVAPMDPPDPAQIPKGNDSEKHLLDLRKQFGIEWHPSTLLATVVFRNSVSNRVTIKLGNSPGNHEQEVTHFLASRKDTPKPVVVSPPAGKPLPSYEELTESPEIPAQPGVALAATRVVVSRPGATMVVRGAFRLRVREHERVTAEKVEGTGRDTVPTAVLGITLLVVGSDIATSSMLRLDVPSWDKLDPQAPVATGHFALDLLAQHLVGTRPQTYFVYAFSGEHLTGPIPTALITEAMLPPGR